MVTRPAGVTALSILSWIGAGLSILSSLALFFGASFLTAILGAIGTFAGAFLIIFGVVILLLGLLEGLIGWGLWKMKNWARKTLVVLSWIGGFFALSSVFNGEYISIVSLAINILIIWYLQFNKEVVAQFS